MRRKTQAARENWKQPKKITILTLIESEISHLKVLVSSEQFRGKRNLDMAFSKTALSFFFIFYFVIKSL